MVAKIGRGANLYGVLSYNFKKVEQQKGVLLFGNNLPDVFESKHPVQLMIRLFEPYLQANNRTEKPILHISLNPDPGDKVTDENFRRIAQDYMERMGYKDQPYLIFKHTDLERSHIHIVSTCVDQNGKKISDTYEKLRSMEICRALEQKYNLVPATKKQPNGNELIFRPVNYKSGDIKSQIASVVRYLPKYYQYQSFGSYNALLSLFNVTAEEVKGEFHGQPKRGLVYFALNEKGEKASNPFKSSLFGKNAGLEALEKHAAQAKEKMKTNPVRGHLKSTIETAIHAASGEAKFKRILAKQGINTVVRRNQEGRIYGITFIDHGSRTVWNGSQLGKNLSANVFHDWWNGNKKPQVEGNNPDYSKKHDGIPNSGFERHLHNFFDLLDTRPIREKSEEGLFESLGSLIPGAQGEDYEELAFENQMKKRKKRRRR